MRSILLPSICLTLLICSASAQTSTTQNPPTAQASAVNSTTPAPAKDKKTLEQQITSDGSILGNPPVYTPAPAKELLKPAEVPPWLTELVAKQFGKEFEIFPKDHQVLFTGDLDGDGVEDAVIVVRSEHPLLGITEHNYKLVAPEEEYYGWKDAKVFANTQVVRWQDQRILLVIHGSGVQGWRAENPKAKFVFINLPFEKIQLSIAKIKKRTQSIIAGDSTVFNAVVFWDGKRYKFSPGGLSE